MPKIVDAAAQRREIRDAALEVFAERGLKGTGLTHVAEAAGMGRSSIYHYYPDKDSLVRDLLDVMLAQEEALFGEMLAAEGTPLARIETFLRRQVALFEAWCDVAPLIFDLRASHARLLRPFFRRIRATLARVIEEGQATGQVEAALDATLAASSIIGAIDGLLLQHYVDRRAFGDRRPLAEVLVTQVLRGLRS
jgi:AcrR family transcriptional regulator